VSDNEGITPAERGDTDSAPAKEEPTLPLAHVPRVARSLWPDVFCLLGAMFVPVLTMSGCLILGWSIFGWRPASDLALVAGTCGVSLGACCLFPLLRTPLEGRIVALFVYGVCASVVVWVIYLGFDLFAHVCEGFNGI
jgi:hypothetical protein